MSVILLCLFLKMCWDCSIVVDKRGDGYYSDDQKDGYVTWLDTGERVHGNLKTRSGYPLQLDKFGVGVCAIILAIVIALIIKGRTDGKPGVIETVKNTAETAKNAVETVRSWEPKEFAEEYTAKGAAYEILANPEANDEITWIYRIWLILIIGALIYAVLGAVSIVLFPTKYRTRRIVRRSTSKSKS